MRRANGFNTVGNFVGLAETALGEAANTGLKLLNSALSVLPPYIHAQEDYEENGDIVRAGVKFSGEMAIGYIGGKVATAFIAAGIAGAPTSGGSSLWFGAIGATTTVVLTNKASDDYLDWVDSWYE